MSTPQRPPSTGPSPVTVLIASLSSVVAAIVVSKVWGPGTLIGAAATPVIVTFVSEALKRPAQRLPATRSLGPSDPTIVQPPPTVTHQPGQPRPRGGAAPDDPTRVVAPGALAAGGAPDPEDPRSRRRWVIPALAAGLVAFVIAAVVLTGSELVFGDSASGGGKTTLFSKGSGSSAKKKKDKKTDTTTTETDTDTSTTETQTVTTTTTTETQTTPAPETTTTEPTTTEQAPTTTATTTTTAPAQTTPVP